MIDYNKLWDLLLGGASEKVLGIRTVPEFQDWYS
jgi:hypothetical protein